MKDNNYPNFEPSLGNLTHKIRKDFIEHSIQNNTLPNDSFENEDIISLVASNDETKPIYFWQLYSIAGEDNIHVLIKTFYENIFSDSNSHWFRDEFFDSGPLEYHIRGQKRFWLDAMGAGKLYLGGEDRLYKKHKLVKNIMTSKGARKWMYHMNETITEMDKYFKYDERILPCLTIFLDYFMEKYSIQFDFNIFDKHIIQSKL